VTKKATQLTLLEMREPTPPAPHPPLVLGKKERARDRTLNAMGRTRAELIEKATEVAVMICKAKGWVTAVDVIRAMRTDRKLAAMLAAIDIRFMGGVLIPSKGWKKLDYVGEGSKGRPIPRWTRRT
jgi:hypothetical protein